jgi:hypothetical protein
MAKDQMDQEVELHDDNEVMEEGHDPKNAEAQSVASVAAAGDKAPTAKKLPKSSTKQDPMQKLPGTKAGMINAAYTKMSGMKKEDLAILMSKIMAEETEGEDAVVAEEQQIAYQADFSDDLKALVEGEATLSEEFKDKAEVIFQAAIKSKLSEEIDRLEEKYNEELAEEVKSTKEDLVEKVDSYLNYVVEKWMEDNKVAIQTGLRTEIAEKFMTGLKDLFTESYIEVPEGKVDLVDELAETVDDLEQKLNSTTADAIRMAEELETYKRDAIIRESARDLAETQVEKLKSLVEDIDFEDAETFAKKVQTVKESYFTKKSATESAQEIQEDEDGETVVAPTGSMAQYLSALKKTANK